MVVAYETNEMRVTFETPLKSVSISVAQGLTEVKLRGGDITVEFTLRRESGSAIVEMTNKRILEAQGEFKRSGNCIAVGNIVSKITVFFGNHDQDAIKKFTDFAAFFFAISERPD